MSKAFLHGQREGSRLATHGPHDDHDGPNNPNTGPTMARLNSILKRWVTGLNVSESFQEHSCDSVLTSSLWKQE